jgi:hypothetical protein
MSRRKKRELNNKEKLKKNTLRRTI